MDEYIVQGPVALRQGAHMRIVDGLEQVIYVWEGAVWITQEGDREDYLRRAGEWFRLDRNGTTVVCAIGKASLTVAAPAREPSAWHRFWSGLFAAHARPTSAAL